MTATIFEPTEYTAALMFQVLQHAPGGPLDDVLEIGTGSGVVLAQMLALGARRALGVDIEAEAVRNTRRLVDGLGEGARAEVVEGDMWMPCAGRRFDLIATNLPQFPVQRPLDDGRLPTWSAGGPDGRALIDRFLAGLPAHLKPGGRAWMTHNEFADLALTRERLRAVGLQASVATTVCAPVPLYKWAGLTPQVVARFLGRGLLRVGPHAFAVFHVLEIAHA
jgi:release factor glutamine methyltransferase